RRGRPRREIDLEKVADAVERLFTEEGYDAVSIDRAAKELEVSRATLYRTVPSKEHLLAILFERMTEELHRAALVIVGDTQASPRERLMGLIEAQIEAAFRQREFLFVLFGGGWLPREFYARWLQWQEQYELVWRTAVTDAIAAGEIAGEDPVITTRLILGMTLWVSRWIRPAETYTADQIARATEELILPAIGHAAPTR
ncbi:MAG TPA: TetR/AcrR family transcriptional regulator, partial [Solirubrobacteraceae bacterium]|nr:TetR/AcrR family transcriptional regulator [Solirubrobacteraceae bacterium]